MGTIQVKRGLSINLPTEAEQAEPLFTTDTKKIYIGNGEGNALTEFENSAQIQNKLATKSDNGHTHVSSNITDFSTAVDERISAQKGVANGLATLDTTGKIPNAQIPNVFKEAEVVDNITARNALNAFQGLHAFVIDATADTTVESGGAEYVYNGTTWIKITEFNNLDTLVDWKNVQNKPSFVQSITDLDDIPDSLEGQSGMILIVKPDETGFAFVPNFDGNIDGGTF